MGFFEEMVISLAVMKGMGFMIVWVDPSASWMLPRMGWLLSPGEGATIWAADAGNISPVGTVGASFVEVL